MLGLTAASDAAAQSPTVLSFNATKALIHELGPRGRHAHNRSQGVMDIVKQLGKAFPDLDLHHERRLRESHVHDVTITKEAPNYRSE